jgi:hypothetical protein
MQSDGEVVRSLSGWTVLELRMTSHALNSLDADEKPIALPASRSLLRELDETDRTFSIQHSQFCIQSRTSVTGNGRSRSMRLEYD